MGKTFADAKTVDLDGATLAYQEKGDGTPVVFVHGAISDLRTWYEQLIPIGES